jgi:hypothetical protein
MMWQSLMAGWNDGIIMKRCSALLRLCQLILRTLENVAETAARNEDLVDVDVMERVHVCVMF